MNTPTRLLSRLGQRLQKTPRVLVILKDGAPLVAAHHRVVNRSHLFNPRALLKGLAKVRCEWSLTTLAYNLKRVLNLVSLEKLMAAAS